MVETCRERHGSETSFILIPAFSNSLVSRLKTKVAYQKRPIEALSSSMGGAELRLVCSQAARLLFDDVVFEAQAQR